MDRGIFLWKTGRDRQRHTEFQSVKEGGGTITGVVDVLSFDLTEILLETDQGMLMIKGSDLHVNRLTLEKGEVDVEGKIDSLTYSDSAGHGNGTSLLGRLFR